MKIREHGNELIIQETPGCLWICGLMAVFVGACFVYLGLGRGSNSEDIAFWVRIIALCMGIIAVVSGYLIIFNAPVSKIVIDRYADTVTYTKRGLFGKKQTVYSFNQIKQFCTIEEKDSEGDLIWALGMIMADGETIKISSLPANDEKVKLNFVFQANQFMYKQMPSFKDAEKLEDEN